MKKVLVVVGPTGAGKSNLAIKIAQKYNGEIISGDSIAVYRGLDIGSAKVTEKEMGDIKHHLIDIRNIDEAYNVFDFQTEARRLIEEISERGKLPIVVGGTGLYIKALLYDYQFEIEEEKSDDSEYDSFTNEELFNELDRIDHESALNIHVNNRKRLIRALNIARNGKRKSDLINQQEHKMIYDAIIMGLTMERDKLYERINRRVDAMIENGLKDEIQNLLLKDNNLFSRRCMQGIGYREWEAYFRNEMTEEEVSEEIKKHSRQFAKRQYTWFNHQMEMKWYDITDNEYPDNIFREIETWL